MFLEAFCYFKTKLAQTIRYKIAALMKFRSGETRSIQSARLGILSKILDLMSFLEVKLAYKKNKY